VNAIATLPSYPVNILAAFALPTPLPQTDPGFLNLINVIFSSPAAAVTAIGVDATNSPTAAAKPMQIADALIRSMLGGAKQAAFESAPVAILDARGPAAGIVSDAPAVAASILSMLDPNGPALPSATASVSPAPIAPSAMTGSEEAQITTNTSDSSRPTLPSPPAAKKRTEQREAMKIDTSRTDPALQLVAAILPVPVAAGMATDFRSESTRSAAPQMPNGASPDSSVPSAELKTGAGSITPQFEVAFEATLTSVASAPTPPTEPMVPAAQPAMQTAAAEPGSVAMKPVQPTVYSQAAAPVKATASVRDDARSKDAQLKVGQFRQPDKSDTPARVMAVAATAQASDFARTFDSPPRPIAQSDVGEAKTEAPYQAVAEALRTSEPSVVAVPAPREGQAQEIAMRIVRPDAPPVELVVMERGGEIHVSVRTPDAGLQNSLRQDLGALTNSLERAGYRAETFVPQHSGGVTQTARSAQNNFQNDRDPSGSSGRGNPGNAQQRREQKQQQQQSTQWIQEMENAK
jgi:hypothetical protein